MNEQHLRRFLKYDLRHDITVGELLRSYTAKAIDYYQREHKDDSFPNPSKEHYERAFKVVSEYVERKVKNND